MNSTSNSNTHIDDPVFLLSFMRSGSNFLSNVVCKSSSQKYSTIYDPNVTPFYDDQPYFILKSHAPSYLHLLSEIGAFAPCLQRLPHKIIVLIRDPRDVFISLHDWFEARFKTTIDQRSFIQNMDYCYSAPGLGKLSPVDAFKYFISNWWEVSEHTSVKSVYRLKFEDLIENKSREFQKIMNFLGLDSVINEDLFGEKVQQLSSSRNERGVKDTHQRYSEKYKDLLEAVGHELSDVIKNLGYP